MFMSPKVTKKSESATFFVQLLFFKKDCSNFAVQKETVFAAILLENTIVHDVLTL